MSKVIILLLLNCPPTLTAGQFLIDGQQRDIIFAPLNNIIELTGFGDCADLEVKVDSFSQKFSLQDCRFELNYLLNDTSEIKVMKGDKVLFKDTLYEIHVKSRTYLVVGGVLLSTGRLTKNDLANIQGIEVVYNDPDLTSIVQEFTLVIEDKVNQPQMFIINGKRIDQATKSYLKSLNQPTTIWIENIRNVAMFEHDMTENLRFEIK